MDESPRLSRAVIPIAAAGIVVGCILGAVAAALFLSRDAGTLTPPPATPPPTTTTTLTPSRPADTPAPPPTEPPQPGPTTIPPTPTYTQFFPDLRPPSRPIDLGISVGPFLPAHRDLLNAMGMTWVKIYDTPQIADYPDQNVLFRVNVDPSDLDGWERGLYNLAPELAQRGAVAVEIGNEPNLAAEWNGSPSPQQFTDALCRAYRAFKETAPRITVVSGGLAPSDNIPGQAANDLEFARGMLDAGAGACFDAWGYHPYGFDQPPEADPSAHPMSFRRAELMHDLLSAYGLGDRPVWLTEFGWLRDPREEGVDCAGEAQFAGFGWMVTPRDTQAVYTARAVSYAADNWPWVGPLFLWNLNWNRYEADYEPVCSHLRWYGVLDSNGTPLPVFFALQQIAG